MNAAEHKKAAERLLVDAEVLSRNGSRDKWAMCCALDMAQTHATLATIPDEEDGGDTEDGPPVVVGFLL